MKERKKEGSRKAMKSMVAALALFTCTSVCFGDGFLERFMRFVKTLRRHQQQEQVQQVPEGVQQVPEGQQRGQQERLQHHQQPATAGATAAEEQQEQQESPQQPRHQHHQQSPAAVLAAAADPGAVGVAAGATTGDPLTSHSIFAFSPFSPPVTVSGHIGNSGNLYIYRPCWPLNNPVSQQLPEEMPVVPVAPVRMPGGMHQIQSQQQPVQPQQMYQQSQQQQMMNGVNNMMQTGNMMPGTDIFSLGVMLYSLGMMPVPGGTDYLLGAAGAATGGQANQTSPGISAFSPFSPPVAVPGHIGNSGNARSSDFFNDDSNHLNNSGPQQQSVQSQQMYQQQMANGGNNMRQAGNMPPWEMQTWNDMMQEEMQTESMSSCGMQAGCGMQYQHQQPVQPQQSYPAFTAGPLSTGLQQQQVPCRGMPAGNMSPWACGGGGMPAGNMIPGTGYSLGAVGGAAGAATGPSFAFSYDPMYQQLMQELNSTRAYLSSARVQLLDAEQELQVEQKLRAGVEQELQVEQKRKEERKRWRQQDLEQQQELAKQRQALRNDMNVMFDSQMLRSYEMCQLMNIKWNPGKLPITKYTDALARVYTPFSQSLGTEFTMILEHLKSIKEKLNYPSPLQLQPLQMILEDQQEHINVILPDFLKKAATDKMGWPMNRPLPVEEDEWELLLPNLPGLKTQCKDLQDRFNLLQQKENSYQQERQRQKALFLGQE
jgi:hypothetical protein